MDVTKKCFGKIFFLPNIFKQNLFQKSSKLLKVVFRIKNRLSSKFTFKDITSKEMRSSLFCKFQRSSCNATCYGKTKRHFKGRISEHMRVSARASKNIKSTKHLVVTDHTLVCNNILSFEYFPVVANGANNFRINLQESLLILRDGPQLNKASESALLILFS